MLVQRLGQERLAPDGRVLDLCTGSGVLAIAAARRWHVAEVVAVDISTRAVLSVRLNAKLNGVSIRAERGDLFAPVRGERFDLIVSNPPYLPGDSDHLPRRGLARAWEGGRDGRLVIDRICTGAPDHLRPGGSVLLVHSSVCGVHHTVGALASQGLDVDIVGSHRGPLGPRLRSRTQLLRQRGLLHDGDLEDIVLIRATERVEQR
jgi:release factor glutamine methyltransferase